MKLHYYRKDLVVTSLPEDTMFVFGSNKAGVHGLGAAKIAREYFGAKLGEGNGPQLRCYALPTKYTPYHAMDLEDIKSYVDRFIHFTNRYHDLKFFITRIGTGYAGYTDAQIAPLFNAVGSNCIVSEAWLPFIEHTSAVEVHF